MHGKEYAQRLVDVGKGWLQTINPLSCTVMGIDDPNAQVSDLQMLRIPPNYKGTATIETSKKGKPVVIIPTGCTVEFVINDTDRVRVQDFRENWERELPAQTIIYYEPEGRKISLQNSPREGIVSQNKIICFEKIPNTYVIFEDTVQKPEKLALVAQMKAELDK